MSLKTKAVVGLTVLGLALGANQMLQPKTLADVDRYRQQQASQDLSDANEQTKERVRDSGNAHGDAENGQRLVPGEHRPPEPRVRIRLRP